MNFAYTGSPFVGRDFSSMYELRIPRIMKTLFKRAVPAQMWGRLKELQRQIAFDGKGPFSFDEVAIMRQINAQQKIVPFFVDIGAQDGVLGSQTLGLAKRGWAGVAYEADPQLCKGIQKRYAVLPDIKVRSELVVPELISSLLHRDGVPHEFGFLSLDIDSFDYDVLENILRDFRPRVICVEINEMIPPPVYFKVKYRPDASWCGDRFQGFSIQAIKDLCNHHCYVIGDLHYNNLLLIASDEKMRLLTDEDIQRVYSEGYATRTDRHQLFPWNSSYNWLIDAEAEDVLAELQILFGDRLDRCDLSIGLKNSGGSH